jgi:hypothetical protein
MSVLCNLTTIRTTSPTLFRRSPNACEAQQRNFEVWNYMCCSTPHRHEKRLLNQSYRTYCFTVPLGSYVDRKAPAQIKTPRLPVRCGWLAYPQIQRCHDNDS